MVKATIDDVGGTMTGEHVEALSRSLREHGYAYLRGIRAGFDHPAEILRLGEYVPQYQGQLIRDVKPDPVMEKAEVSANNMKGLTPHTECFEYAGRPPRCVALWCGPQPARAARPPWPTGTPSWVRSASRISG